MGKFLTSKLLEAPKCGFEKLMQKIVHIAEVLEQFSNSLSF